MFEIENINMSDIDYNDFFFEEFYDPILIMKDNCYINCNKATLKMLKMNFKYELLSMHPSQISPLFQDDGTLSEKKANILIEKAKKLGFIRFEWMHKDIVNNTFWVEVTIKVLANTDKNILYVTWRDINLRKSYEHNLINQNIKFEQKNSYINSINKILKKSDTKSVNLIKTLTLLQEYQKAIDASSMVIKTDLNGYITYVNDKFCNTSGYLKEELIGKSHEYIIHSNTSKKVLIEQKNILLTKNIFKGIMCNKKKNGGLFYVDITIIPILNENEELVEYIGIRNDITALYEKDKIISKQNTDILSSLPNRQKLLEDIENFINPKLAIFDIDGFKNINEFYGFDTADKLLILIAQDLKTFLQINTNVYRLVADKFALLTYGNIKDDVLIHLCKIINKHFRNKIFIIDENEFNISFTIGISTNKHKIISHAEMALTQAKNNFKELINYDIDTDLKDKVINNITLLNQIKTAIKNDNVLVFIQKIINNKTKEIKYECLVRIKLENGNILTPNNFLEQAKKAKLYLSLTKIIIRKSTRYFEDKNSSFSINLTIQDILDNQTMNYLYKKLKETKTATRAILEIVESEGIERFKEVHEFIKKFKSIGCKIAIDDFGTGYSNFEYLIKLNIDIIKIDGSLIKNIHNDKNAYITVSTIVSFAKLLNLDIVAEYVHCKEVQEIVEKLEITYSQGFHIHEPINHMNTRDIII